MCDEGNRLESIIQACSTDCQEVSFGQKRISHIEADVLEGMETRGSPFEGRNGSVIRDFERDHFGIAGLKISN
jgi:hypothetical protein